MTERIGRSCATLICFAATLLSTPAAVQQSPRELLHALFRADSDSALPQADRWPDLSPNALRDREAEDRTTLAKLQGIRRKDLATEDRTLYDLFERELRQRLEQFSLRLYLTPYWDDTRFGPTILQIPDAARNESFPTNEEQAQQLLRKLESFPGYVTQVISLLRQGKDAGMLPAAQLARQEVASIQRLTAGALIGMSQPFARPGRNSPATPATANVLEMPDRVTISPFYRPFASLPASVSDRARLALEAKRLIRERVQPAIDDLRNFLAREYLPACHDFASLAEWPNGTTVYAHLVRRYTTTGVGPTEIHQLGLKEVARIREAMSVVIAKSGHTGSLNEFLADARTNPRFYFGNEDDLVAAYRTALARILPLVPKVVGTTPRKPLIVEPGRQGGPAAAYMPPRPGMEQAAILVDVTNLKIRPKFEVLPLMLHEGVPGHHLQIALEMESRPDASTRSEFEQRLRRSVAFTEGWALYAEGLGDELGLYSDPIDKFGQLSMDLTRAVRLVIDTGMHASGWSAARAKEYFIAQTGKADAAADEEIMRTIRPGTQLAYKVGEQRILMMRSLTRKTLGPNFDLRRFDDALLRWGPLPLDVFERKLDECLHRQSCSADLASVVN